jgi:hypothetical protein
MLHVITALLGVEVKADLGFLLSRALVKQRETTWPLYVEVKV